MKQSVFASLFPHLWPAVGPCPFVIDQDAVREIVLRHYDGGRDATYVTVSRRSDAEICNRNDSASKIAVTIRYAPFVQGTTIIYDATDQSLQGKARPFSCDLSQQPYRMYALLPFQIEGAALRTNVVGIGRYLKVAFVDARGERIQAALPFELRLLDRDEKPLSIEACATDRDGQFTRSSPYFAAGPVTKAVVRSRLSGREESLTL